MSEAAHETCQALDKPTGYSELLASLHDNRLRQVRSVGRARGGGQRTCMRTILAADQSYLSCAAGGLVLGVEEQDEALVC